MAPTTFLMSYPGPDWQIRGKQNFRSRAGAAANPRQAFREWLGLCDAITRAGGHILVMPPAPVQPPLTGMIYTANAGQLFHNGAGWVYLLSRMSVAHRQPEPEAIRPFLVEAGITVVETRHAWEGQADLQMLPGNRFIATWGVRSDRASLEDVRPHLPSGARFIDLQIQEPFFHGDTCLNAVTNLANDTFLLAHSGAFVDNGVEALRPFLGSRIELVPVDEDDALAYACNALCVNGTILLPEGVSTSLRGQLARRGFKYEELALGELFGKGGGGPRCLVNDLRGLVLNAGAPSYEALRDRLFARLESWPEAAPTPPPATTTPSAVSAVSAVSAAATPPAAKPTA